jgi:ATP-dependent helicase/nuclease subunit B
MTAIEKNQFDVSTTGHFPAAQPWPSLWPSLWQQVDAHAQALGAHPARTVVLLPFFQLQTVARSQARLHWSSGFSPRLETTKSWSQRLAHMVPSTLDIRFDAGLDSLCAQRWLQQAGLGHQQDMLSAALVQAAHQLGGLVAAVPPAQRDAWGERMREQVLLGLDGNPLMYEAAVARIALEWALASRYGSDVLFDDSVRADVDALVVVQGVQANPLAQALAQHWASISCLARLAQSAQPSVLALHPCSHAHDEADRAAACVLQHIAHGHAPVALAAVDRVSTRRISAKLQLHGVALVDETGWKLSTTRAAASVMALLRAARSRAQRGAGSATHADDALLDWLKHTNAPSGQVDALEIAFRKQNSPVVQIDAAQAAIEFIVNALPDGADMGAPNNPLTATEAVDSSALSDAAAGAVSNAAPNAAKPTLSIATLLGSLRASRPIAPWLQTLQQALLATGQWGALMADTAGRDCVQALHLLQPEALADFDAKLSLADFSAWASDCLENASYKPSTPEDAATAQVVVLPLAQVLARPFGAIVIAAADEQRLPAVPEPQGVWTAAQRNALGLPSRDALAAEQLAVWQHAMHVPQADARHDQAERAQALQAQPELDTEHNQAPRIDVLWRSQEGEQAVQPSPLLQRWRLSQPTQTGIDPRVPAQRSATPTARPQPSAQGLRVTSLSASSYSDLRACPYRFFALRLLGLQEANELDTDADKRDFGNWLHSVLADFHTRRKAKTDTPTGNADLVALIDQCAADQPSEGSSFIPFAAAWPQVRDSYLAWLAQHEAEGWVFDASELKRSLSHEGITLQGRLDRVDRLGRSALAGTAYVLDYKTESVSASQQRVKNPLEDTQLAFYAALLGEDDLHAAYLNLAEKKAALTVQPEIMAARDALLQGIAVDVQRIHAGHALPALGEGMACEYCAARGLCRKDMWAL